ncbi:MAG: bifunctional phosphopantothenoylcysteine decarboxylase/phosphopantothenate--cysteine ligase CoaBC [Thermoplasmata archaeon]|nr:bifunctional phosphopantothenoylcysteine decarboxylase/phosphopantothenate--cysteine ligase CoaBC [Thermoplasmata archaeon]
MDPTESIKGRKGNLLSNKKIVFAITGSVSAEEAVKIARELIRYGAEIYPVMSEDSKEMITSTAIEYATGKKPIEKISGLTEHVILEKECDLLLIAPCSANTLSKIACGVGDTSVTLFALTFLGSKPIIISPAMSKTMYNNPIIEENINKLRSLGITIIEPKMEEGKAKLPSNDTIVANVIRILNKKMKRKILIIGGSTEEPIDDIRVITNRSSGKTSIEVAKAAFYLGNDVTLFLGRSEIEPPEYIKTKRFRTFDDLLNMIDEMVSYDTIIVPAALSDFKSEKIEGKIKSDSSLKIQLEPLPKFLKILREKYKKDLIAFKAEFGYENLINESRKMIEEYSLKFVVANDMRDVKRDETKILIVRKNSIIEYEGKKSDIGLKIMQFYFNLIEHNE